MNSTEPGSGSATPDTEPSVSRLSDVRLALYPHKKAFYALATIRAGDWLAWCRTGSFLPAALAIPDEVESWARRKGVAGCGAAASVVSKIRATPEEAERRELKGKLPAVTWGYGRIAGERGTLLKRDKQDAGLATGFLCFDIDGAKDGEEAAALRDALFDRIPFAFAAGVSAGGAGVWLVCVTGRAVVGMGEYAAAWWTVAAVLRTDHGVEIGASSRAAVDRAPSNIVSYRFYSRDGGLRVRDDPEPAPLPDDLDGVDLAALRVRAGCADPPPPPKGKRASAGSKRAKTASESAGRVPPYDGRPGWAAGAHAAGEKAHGRCLRATFADVRDGRLPDDARIDAYARALGREDPEEARREVERMVQGAVEKAAAEGGGPRRRKPGCAPGRSGVPPPEEGCDAAANIPPDYPPAAAVGVFESEGGFGRALDAALPREGVLHVEATGEWRMWMRDRWSDVTGMLTAWAAHVGEWRYRKRARDGELVSDRKTGGKRSTVKAALACLLDLDWRRRNLTDEHGEPQWNHRPAVLGLPDGECVEVTPAGAKRRKQRLDDYLTHRLRMKPSAEWRGGVFEWFLNRVVPDRETRDWVQRAFGYALISDGTEQRIVWLRGAERSGKSTLIAFIRGVMGHYFQAVPGDALQMRHAQHHPAREAVLASARLAVWSEAKDGGLLDVERACKWSGGDPEQSHFMRKDPFLWVPKFLLTFVSNGDLELSYPAPQLYERVTIVDCWSTIPKEERSLDVWVRAVSGDPDCLAWLLEGAAGWMAQRAAGPGTGFLPETEKMRRDMTSWKSDADHVSRFVYTACKRTDVPETSGRALHRAYREWLASHDSRQRPLAEKNFLKRVRAMGGWLVEGKARDRLTGRTIRGFNHVA